ncbi:hypothetical protein DXG01_001132, partial [Tephrocybe rancida]
RELLPCSRALNSGLQNVQEEAIYSHARNETSPRRVEFSRYSIDSLPSALQDAKEEAVYSRPRACRLVLFVAASRKRKSTLVLGHAASYFLWPPTD